MAYLVDLSRREALTVGATGVRAVLQNVRLILSVRRGTVPLDREFGLSATFLDKPMPEARALLAGEIVEAVRRWEPRAAVLRVDFTPDTAAAMEGRLYPVVLVEVSDV
ncbi:MAG: hypothetical protein FD177_2414 [Desulfovibrionaceae bacterium]|nr:MAG: hypothetical protein FD177_2414 [Desulfovibrionaceae bacterium]